MSEDQRHVTTAAELEAMTPAERHDDFRAGIVLNPDELPVDQRKRLERGTADAIARHQARRQEQKRAS
jgi:hypothetical protein